MINLQWRWKWRQENTTRSAIESIQPKQRSTQSPTGGHSGYKRRQQTAHDEGEGATRSTIKSIQPKQRSTQSLAGWHSGYKRRQQTAHDEGATRSTTEPIQPKLALKPQGQTKKEMSARGALSTRK
jgi:hypothetical protein